MSYFTRQELSEVGKRLLQLIPLITFISSGIMHVVLVLLLGHSESSYGATLLASFIYSSIFSTVLTVAFRMMEHYVPLQTPAAVVQHVLVMSLLTLMCYFSGVAITNYFIYGDGALGLSGRLISFLITVMIAVTVLGVFYVQLFISRNKAARKKALEAELAALRAQINPHFLFNSLNSIAALVHLDAHKSEAVTEDLAELFRYSLNASKKGKVSLAEELEACHLYLRIEKARFGERLQVHDTSDKAVHHYSIPALIVQPLVENAIKHGLQKQPGAFQLTMAAALRQGRLLITITDSGPGMDPEQKENYLAQGTGLSNVRMRMQAEFGGAANLHILPDGVCLSLPAIGA